MSGATKILMGSGGVVLPSDDEFNNVSFLSHFDGSNNGTNIVYDDSSASNHTISVNGTPSQGTFGPFSRVDGEWSNWFDGTNDVIYLDATGSDFAFGTGAFTIEGWYYSEGTDETTWGYLLAMGDMLTVYQYNDTTVHFTMALSNAAAASANVISVNTTNPLNQWNHFAITRSGSNMSAFLNGTRIGTVSDASGTFLAPSGGGYKDDMHFGAFNDGAEYAWGGYLSNFRVVKGTAVYDPTSSSCTVPTSALTAISGTAALTCQSNRFKDNSASAHAITVVGLPEVKAFTPILTSKVYDSAVNGASAYFDGTNGYLSAADSSDWDLGSGSYTVEAWVWAGAGVTASTYNNIVGQWPQTGAASTNSWIMENSGGVVVGYAVIGGTATLVAQSATLPLAQWVHVALVRNGNAHNIYLNGVAGATTTNTNAYDTGTGAVEVGGFSHSSLADGNWDGYISNVRVVKGTAVYTSNFTPPTAPLTAVTNTKLLLNMADGQVLDSAAQNNMTLTNGAVTSTTQEKFGTASLDLTATDAWVTFPASTNDFGSGNFTIEAWVYVEDVSAYNSIISYGDPIQFYVKSGTLECYAKPLITSGGFVTNFKGPASSISNDTWCHVAMVRNGTEFTAYVNGVGGTTHDSGSTAALTAYTGTASIGAYNSAAGGAQALSFDGYIDDLRVSNFARYTSNFTPSTEAFPDKGQ